MPNFFEVEFNELKKVKENGLYLQELSHRQHELLFCTEATRSDPFALEFVCQDFKQSYDFVLPLVQEKGAVLELAAACLQNNFVIVFTAVTNCPLAIFFASNRLKENPSIFRAAYHNGFKNFINPKYVDYLRDCGDLNDSCWVKSLIDDPNKLKGLLTGKNQVELDKHSRIASMTVRSLFFEPEMESKESNDNAHTPRSLRC